MTGPSAVLPRNDFLRTPVLGTARPSGFKEWHHYLLQGPDWQLLVNFSVSDEALGGRRPGLVPRIIVIAHARRWTGVVERFIAADMTISPDLSGIAIGRNRMRVSPDGYDVTIDLPERGISGELRLAPMGTPAVTRVNNQPVGTGRINWLFVPRMRADGWFRVGDRDYHAVGCPAYHDHNWGHFHWGDDFGWEWAAILPTAAEDPWSLVYTRTTDRHRLRCVSQALYLWHGDAPVAMFRDAAIRTRAVGRLGRGPDLTLPPTMALLLDGAAADVPESLEITARSPIGVVEAVFRPRSHMRLAQPSELALDRCTVLSEISGTARLSGLVRGQAVAAAGAGVVEQLRG